MGTLPKISIVSISAPGKLLILNHRLSDRNDNVSATYVMSVDTFYDNEIIALLS